MKPRFKSLLRKHLPPALANLLRSVAGTGSRWTGDYPNWSSAVAASSGYAADAIFERVCASARAVRDGRALWERDSVCFQHEEYNWPLLACLMGIAAGAGGRLHVLDFGGALGSTYMQHRRILAALRECSWSVVEQPRLVQAGRLEFTHDRLDFHDSIEQCFVKHPVNVVLFSSVLQYLEDPYSLLGRVSRLAPQAIIIDRTPLARTGERITVQRVPDSIYRASYACRFLDRQRLREILAHGRTLTPWFASPFDPPEFVGVMATLDKSAGSGVVRTSVDSGHSAGGYTAGRPEHYLDNLVLARQRKDKAPTGMPREPEVD